MLHRSPPQHCTTSSGVGGPWQRRDASSAAATQPLSRTDVPFSTEREVKHRSATHRLAAPQEAPSHTHSIHGLGSPAQRQETMSGGNNPAASEEGFIARAPPSTCGMTRDYPTTGERTVTVHVMEAQTDSRLGWGGWGGARGTRIRSTSTKMFQRHQKTGGTQSTLHLMS